MESEVATQSRELDAGATPGHRQSLVLTPTTIKEAIEFAELLSKSNMVPKEYQGNPGNILVAIQWGAELGLAPMQALQSISTINGRPQVWGDTPLALVRASGLLDAIHEEIGEEGASCTVKRRGQPPITRSFSKADAVKAKLWDKDSPWRTYPKRMLQLRARAYALRDEFTDVLRGMRIGEEHIGREEIDITPAAAAATAGAPSPADDRMPYPQADFDKNLTSWRELIASGKRDADSIIATVETKFLFSEEQKKTIRALPVAAAA
jgi:hypothetical protein